MGILRVVLGTVLLAAAASPVSATPASQVDALFAEWNTTRSPGCAVAVLRDGRIAYEQGYGMADLDHGIPITPTTVFHVASVSKQFTAAAILLLVQEGKVGLDDPVRKYVPELPDFGTPITVRELLHHTSGIRDQWELLELSGWRYSLDLITDDDVLRVVSRQKGLNFPPGTKYSYSNTGYTLLAQIVARVSGQSLREFTAARFFGPLGMRNTHFRDDHAEIVPGIAYGYVKKGDAFSLSVTNFDTVGATSLLTTVEDLARWDENFYAMQVGGPSLIAGMQERGVLANGKQIAYAAGLRVDTYRGLPIVTHSGSDAGYRSVLLRFPQQHFSVTCLCNVGESNPTGVAQKIAEIYLGDKMQAPSVRSGPTAIVPPARLAAQAGTYVERGGHSALRVSVTQGKLNVRRSEDADEAPLAAIAEGRYQEEDDPDVTVEFSGGTANAAARATLRDGEESPQVYERVPDYLPSAKELARYAGEYGSEEIEARYRIGLRNGKLVLSSMKLAGIELEPFAPDVFSAREFGALHFTHDSRNTVTGFIFNTHRTFDFPFLKLRAQ